MTSQQHESLNVDRVCFVCGITYKERENIGKWDCREHPGTIRNNRFTCCGLYTFSDTCVEDYYKTYKDHEKRGCIRSDHRETMLPYSRLDSGRRRIPDEWVTVFHITKLTGLSGEKENYYYYRYDYLKRIDQHK
jgi:hypothetical protein